MSSAKKFLVNNYIVLLTIVIISISVFFYKINKKISKIYVNSYKILHDNNQIKLDKVATLLRTYEVFNQNGAIKLTRFGSANDGGYIAPDIAISSADAIMGYGIANDISFEEHCAETFSKPTYGFDCGIDKIDSKSQWVHFVPQCIATDNFLYSNYTSSQNISSYTQQLNDLKLNNKKIFIKMDIEGAEYEAFRDIYQHHNNITGIVIEIHFNKNDADSINRAIQLLQNIDRNFFLVHVHGNSWNLSSDYTFTTNNSIGSIPQIIELTYINKNLVSHAHLKYDQTHPTKLDMPTMANKPDAVFEIIN